MEEERKPYQYDDFPKHDGITTSYSRANIEAWLSYWPDFFETEEAETNLKWAVIKGDLLHAVEQCPLPLQHIFDYVSLAQMTIYEAAEIMNVRQETAKRYWRGLVRQVCFMMSDSMIYRVNREPTVKYNHSRACPPVGKYPCPVKP